MADERKSYLGGTDIGAIMGIDRFRTPLDVYQQKRGEGKPTEVNPHMQRGLFLEDHIRDMVSTETGYEMMKGRFRRHPKYEWAGGTPDGFLIPRNGCARQTRGVLEIKAPRASVCSKVSDGGPLPAWVTQTQWYMMLCEMDWALIAVFNADEWQLRTFELDADPELHEKMIALGNSFWLRTQKGDAPAPDESIEPIEIPKVSGDAIPREDEEWTAAMESYRSAYRLKQQAVELEEAARARLKELAGDYGRYISASGKVSYLLQEGRATFQRKFFEAEHPEIQLDHYYRRGQPFERFTVTVTGGE